MMYKQVLALHAHVNPHNHPFRFFRFVKRGDIYSVYFNSTLICRAEVTPFYDAVPGKTAHITGHCLMLENGICIDY